jgi:hypothetical protein
MFTLSIVAAPVRRAVLFAPFAVLLAAAPAGASGGGQSYSIVDLSGSKAVEKGRGPFLKYVSSNCGGSPGLCIIPAFHKVGKKRRLEVTSLSCELSTDGSYGESVDLRANRGGGSEAAMDFFQPLTTISSISDRTQIARGETRMTLNAGDTLSIDAHATGTIDGLDCKVAGETVYLK